MLRLKNYSIVSLAIAVLVLSSTMTSHMQQLPKPTRPEHQQVSSKRASKFVHAKTQIADRHVVVLNDDIAFDNASLGIWRAENTATANSHAQTYSGRELQQEYSPLLKGVDHFFATSSEPEVLLKFFRDVLGLPQVWDFKNFGDFASGGVWMGNVEFEVVTWKTPHGEKLRTEFKGIAFEPVGYTDTLVQELDRRGIKHGEPEKTVMKDKEGREFIGWINTGLDGPGGIPPSNLSIFVYDSTSKEKKAARNDKSNAALQKAQGGSLGVVGVSELTIGVTDLKAARVRWRMLRDRPDAQSDDLYRFAIGPAIRLIAAPTDGFTGIVLKVQSLRKAKEFLAQRNLLKKSIDQTVAIDPSAIGGLSVTLEQANSAPPADDTRNQQRKN